MPGDRKSLPPSPSVQWEARATMLSNRVSFAHFSSTTILAFCGTVATTACRAAASPGATTLAPAFRELVPGTPIRGARQLRAGMATYVFYTVHNEVRHVTGMLWRNVIIDRTPPRGRLTLVQRWQFPQGTTSDTSVLYLDTMEPISFRGEQRDQSYTLDFAPSRVRGTRRGGDGAIQQVDLQWPTSFYNEVVDEIFAAAQPLAEGFAYAYRAYNPGEDPRRLTVRVVGSERLPVSLGDSVDTWVVEQRGIQQLVVRWWFAKDTREELRMRVLSPDGDEYGALPLRVPESPPKRR